MLLPKKTEFHLKGYTTVAQKFLNLKELILHASCNFYHLLMNFANSFDPDLVRQIVGPVLEPNCLTLMIFLKDFFFEKKNDFLELKKKSAEDKRACKINQ